MDEERSNRIAGWSGIVFSILSLIVLPLAVPPPPGLGASGADLSAWFTAHRTSFLVGNYLGIAAFFPGFVQLAVLVARIRRREREEGFLASLVLMTGTFTYAIFACSLVVFQVLPFIVDRRLEGPMEAMGSFASVWFALDGLAALPMVLAVGWATRATGVLPRWFAHFSWIVALLALMMSFGAVSTEPRWFAGGGAVTGAGFVGFFVWTMVMGVMFVRRSKGQS